MLPNMKMCPECKIPYPRRFDKCPSCHKDAKSETLMLTQEQIERATEISLQRGDLDEEQVK